MMKKNYMIMAASLLFIFLIYAAVELMIPLPFGNKPIEFEIKRGATFKQVVNTLSERGLVRDRWVIYTLGRMTGMDRGLHAGFYSLWGSMSPWQIFTAIRLGKIIEYEITVVPGDSLREIETKFTALRITESEEFQRLCTDRDFLHSLEVDAPSLEGYLFPDTYRFPKGLEAKAVLIIMVKRLRKQFDDQMMARQMEMDIPEKELLTIASIVEKEAISDKERPIIAGVYYNRLKKRMPLQADPTAKGDLLRKTPYNTYVISGLPPGPIASPGLKSIQAALNPADVPYLYFISNNDGTHNFSVTLSNHENAVKAYRGKK